MLSKLRQFFLVFNFPGKLAKLEISSPTASQDPDNPPIQKSIFLFHFFSLSASRDTFVPTKIVLKVGFLVKNGPKNTLCKRGFNFYHIITSTSNYFNVVSELNVIDVTKQL
jgi:hypothetical protein